MDTNTARTELVGMIKTILPATMVSSHLMPIRSSHYRINTRILHEDYFQQAINKIEQCRPIFGNKLHFTNPIIEHGVNGIKIEFSFIWNGKISQSMITNRWKRRATQSKRRALYA